MESKSVKQFGQMKRTPSLSTKMMSQGSMGTLDSNNLKQARKLLPPIPNLKKALENKKSINIRLSQKGVQVKGHSSQSMDTNAERIRSMQAKIDNLLYDDSQSETDAQSSSKKYSRETLNLLQASQHKRHCAEVELAYSVSSAKEDPYGLKYMQTREAREEHAQRAADPRSEEEKRADRAKAKRRKRIKFITQKIKEMQKKRTFMTAPNAVEGEDEEQDQDIDSEEHPPVAPESDIFEDYNNMLKDVIATQNMMHSGTDDLAELRAMIQKTKVNIASHVTTVDQLKSQLVSIAEQSDEFLAGKPLKQIRSQQQLMGAGGSAYKKMFKEKIKNQHQQSKKNLKGENNEMIFSGKQVIPHQSSQQDLQAYTEKTKMEIVNTLLNINGSMKEFSEEIESKLGKAYRSAAGKKYGSGASQMRRVGSQVVFKKNDLDQVERQAKEYLQNNQRFLRKNVEGIRIR